MDPYLIYALIALGGWLLRHFGVGANLQLPGLPSSSAAPAASNHPLLNNAWQALKATFEAKVAAELENYVKQAKPAQ